MLPEEYHWRRESETEVVVLHRLLEHLLHRSRAAWREHDASEGYGEDGVFAYAVVEPLCNVRCERC